MRSTFFGALAVALLAGAPASTLGSVPDPAASRLVADALGTRRAAVGQGGLSFDSALARDAARAAAGVCGAAAAQAPAAAGDGLLQSWYRAPEASATSTSALVEQAGRAWYGESTGLPSGYASSPPVGHFSQAVWRASTQVGCCVCNAYGGSRKYRFVVCHYGPSGGPGALTNGAAEAVGDRTPKGR